MKTFRVVRNFDPARLHAELLAAGIGVICVRAGSPDQGGPAIYGVVVTDDAAAPGPVNMIINAHVETRVPSRAADPAARSAALGEMETL